MWVGNSLVSVRNALNAAASITLGLSLIEINNYLFSVGYGGDFNLQSVLARAQAWVNVLTSPPPFGGK